MSWWAPPHVVIIHYCICVRGLYTMMERRPEVGSLFTLPALWRLLISYFFFSEGHIYLELYPATSGKETGASLTFLVVRALLCSVNMLKENIVMPGPIFIVFSLPPCWLCFLIGISGLSLQTVPFIKGLRVLSSPWLAGLVFSFVTGSFRRVQKCVALSYTAEVLWNNKRWWFYFC